jgi:Protein of unknown function DUF262
MTPEPFRLPPAIMRGGAVNFTMGELTHRHSDPKGERNFRDPEGKLDWLLDYILPPFQRPPVWTKAQARRFIESAWMGISLGTYVVNRNDHSIGSHTDLWLIDGQQRLRAVQSYLEDEFPVFGMRFSKLNARERRHWAMNIAFPCIMIHEADETKLRDLYNRLNFGGTAHKRSQKA